MRQVTIGGLGYQIEPLGGVSAARVLLPAARLAPAFVEASTALAAGRFGRASVALQAAQENDLATLIDAFKFSTKVEAPRAPNMTAANASLYIPLADCFDRHFTGKIGDQLKWIIECFELNFADFLADMSTAPAQAADPA